ncbi:MAG: DNA-3-methyladenine glycosylase I [Bacteroidota bacterium]|nr:DNA-3-methyladenine glycosylase I [Bacteroidota bacterium]
MKKRCQWPGEDALMIHYHDEEWGVAVYDDKRWFEYLVLDTFQAGLSWKIILHKREAFRQVFHHFDVHKVAAMSHQEMQNCLQNKAIIRNWLKIKATVTNAQAFLKIQSEVGSFNQYIWSFTNGKPIHHYHAHSDDIPTTSDESHAMSKDLKNRGFTFVGSTICYAFMQAAGMVNDHTIDCFRHKEIIMTNAQQ